MALIGKQAETETNNEQHKVIKQTHKITLSSSTNKYYTQQLRTQHMLHPACGGAVPVIGQ
jgi:hypothetical protein